jgi:hypothetical protein
MPSDRDAEGSHSPDNPMGDSSEGSTPKMFPALTSGDNAMEYATELGKETERNG